MNSFTSFIYFWSPLKKGEKKEKKRAPVSSVFSIEGSNIGVRGSIRVRIDGTGRWPGHRIKNVEDAENRSWGTRWGRRAASSRHSINRDLLSARFGGGLLRSASIVQRCQRYQIYWQTAWFELLIARERWLTFNCFCPFAARNRFSPSPPSKRKEWEKKPEIFRPLVLSNEFSPSFSSPENIS